MKLLRLLHRGVRKLVTPRKDLEKLGSDYGGWIIPRTLVGPESVCYSGGAGEDVTFDLALIDLCSCNVYAFDPTPRAMTHCEPVASREPKFHFRSVGIWSEDTTLRFYAPRNPAHVSHSALNLAGTDTYFEAPCQSLRSLMSELGHERIDLLKLDIEGAEHEVVRSMLKSELRPKILCIEIDRPVTAWDFAKTTTSILRSGYRLVAVDGWNFSYVHRTVDG